MTFRQRLARTLIGTLIVVAACISVGLTAPVDGPFGDFSDPEGYKAAAFRSAVLGCEGKWAIHPSQIAHANEVFSPSDAEVQKAQADAPHQWQTWWWVCVGGQILFLPFVFVMAGRWSPRKAREDEREHEALVQRELAALQGSAS